jgi:hypothetical protein
MTQTQNVYSNKLINLHNTSTNITRCAPGSFRDIDAGIKVVKKSLCFITVHCNKLLYNYEEQ